MIDPLTNFVEHPEVVADRFEHVAHVSAILRRVLAGTDCGFDTSAGTWPGGGRCGLGEAGGDGGRRADSDAAIVLSVSAEP